MLTGDSPFGTIALGSGKSKRSLIFLNGTVDYSAMSHMQQKRLRLKGSIALEQILTREQVAKTLTPPVSVRMVQKYLYLAALYLPEFKQFLDTEKGGLNRAIKLTNYHIPTLQYIRSEARKVSLKRIAVKLSQENPHET